MERLIDELLARFPAKRDEGLIAVVDLTVLIAVPDGRIEGAEVAALAESMEAMVGGRLDPSLVGHLVAESRAQLGALGAEACARTVGEVLAAHGAAEEGLRLALAVASASEGLSATELERIQLVAQAAGVSSARLDELIARG